MISGNMLSQSFSRRCLLLTMWALMFKTRKMCFHVDPCVGLIPVTPVTDVTVPDPCTRLVKYQTHGLSYQHIQVCKITALLVKPDINK